MDMNPFRTLVRTEGVRLYRDLPWRRTRDPYEIWLSEVMLQQTQVARVEARWVEWLDRFPSVFALAEAGTAEVLAAWQGMGYNRRALALKAAAEQIAFDYDGVFPTEVKELVALPGIGDGAGDSGVRLRSARGVPRDEREDRGAAPRLSRRAVCARQGACSHRRGDLPGGAGFVRNIDRRRWRGSGRLRRSSGRRRYTPFLVLRDARLRCVPQKDRSQPLSTR
mgnify:CR=1 FL=1